LPLASGGLVRGVADRRNNKLPQDAALYEEERQAAGDRSSGTLLASGYIAGGALAGIIIAITAGVLTDFDSRMAKWAESANPFFAGPDSNLLTLIPYALIIALLYWVAREKAKK
jgi:hypothetical protein